MKKHSEQCKLTITSVQSVINSQTFEYQLFDFDLKCSFLHKQKFRQKSVFFFTLVQTDFSFFHILFELELKFSFQRNCLKCTPRPSQNKIHFSKKLFVGSSFQKTY